MSAVFTVRTIHPQDGRVEVGTFDLEPALPQGQVVCNLFAEFLAERPAEFRERLPFLNKVAVDLEWTAASGGSAFLSLFHEDAPLAMAVLVSGADEESSQQMIEAFAGSVLAPMLGERAGALAEVPERPAVLLLQLPDSPEHFPMVQLLATAIASVYFRAIARITAGAG
ncbi:MAG: hypothetical protein FJW39_25550 [Acidobacteria bacterium]|nr:hypothetical protein [Acidobacteriota bacterium]